MDARNPGGYECLQNTALVRLFLWCRRLQSRNNRLFVLVSSNPQQTVPLCSCAGKHVEKHQTYLIKHVFQLILRQRTALDVLDGTELFCHPLAVFSPDGGHLLLGQLFPDAGVIAQIDLGADNQARHARAVVMYLGEPLLADVLEGCR